MKEHEDSNMRCLVIVKANKDSEAGTMPTRELVEKMGKFNEQLIAAGVLLAADGLKPSAYGKRVAFTAAEPVVKDGPFEHTGELASGYWIWRVQSVDEAVDWLKRSPFGPGAEVEVRPIFEPEDFSAAMQRG